jgi:serine/threonine protein phosphatase PrpC
VDISGGRLGAPSADGEVSASGSGAALNSMLRAAHVLAGYDVPDLIRDHVAAFGGVDAVCYLADLQQTVLVPFLGPGGPGVGEHVEPLPIDSTLAGRVFQHLDVLAQQRPNGDTVLWLPLLDGSERLGVLAVTLRDVALNNSDDDPTQAPVAGQLRDFASLAGELIMTKTLYGDTIVRLRRRAEMGLAAEMQWSLLPPLTFACPQLSVAGVLEPAYEVAGDTFDYAVDPGIANLAVFDGMGHGLRSAQMAVVAVAAYRHARRAGRSLADICEQIDQVLLQTSGGQAFSTAVLVQLDTISGALHWINAGHPEPLLIRNGQLIKSLHVAPRPPLGIDLRGTRASPKPPIGSEQLEPGDSVLLHTDGVTEARAPDGTFFGDQRLTDLIIRNLAAGLPAPETMRRVVRALLEHQQGNLSDDASLVLVQWQANLDPLEP